MKLFRLFFAVLFMAVSCGSTVDPDNQGQGGRPGGQTGNVWGDAVFAAAQAASLPLWLSSLADEIIVDVPDKIITLILVYIILKALPDKLTTLYEEGDRIERLD